MKQLAFINAFVISATVLAATPAGAAETFQMGERSINAKVGLFGFAGQYGSTTVPPITVGYDQAINNNVSVGGLVGYARSSQDFGYLGLYSWSYTYNYILLGGTGTFHLGEILKATIKDAPIDPYVGGVLGYNIVTATFSGSGYGSYAASGNTLLFGFHAGARYYFTPQLAAQMEFGYGVGLISLGLAYKL